MSQFSGLTEPAARVARGLRDAIYRGAKRIAARRGLLGLLAAGLLLLVIASGLTLGAAILAFAAALASVAAIPNDRTQDFDDKLSAEQRETPQARHVQTLIDALPDAAMCLDRGGRILFFNMAARDHFGNLRTGSHISSVLRTPEFLDALATAQARGESVNIIHAERVPVGRRFAVTAAPLDGDEGNRAPAMLVLLRDFSEQERVDQMRADFVANASHELRTPLASLRGFIETLQGSAKHDPAAQERFLKVMANQAERMSRLIDDLLSLSRVEMNAHLPLTELVDLNEVVTHVAETLEPLAGARRQILKVQRAEGAAKVRGDRDELVQLFQNLAQNAIKYGREGGRIDIRIARGGAENNAQIAVSVTDEGPGIAREHIPRLTERFYRVDVASSREKGGTGLGLAIVKHVLARHRGELEIQSELSKGSTFTVHLNETD